MKELAIGGIFALQALAMLVDEFVFHRARGLPNWEKISHPIDTLLVIGCVALALALPPTEPSLRWYLALAALSCLSVTKDEFVHADPVSGCGGAEHWLHSVLFLLHPLLLLGIVALWQSPLPAARTILLSELTAASGFLCYQLAELAPLARSRASNISENHDASAPQAKRG